MPHLETPGRPAQILEPKGPWPAPPHPTKRLRALEKLVRAIEDELSNDELDDEQKLQNIGERIAGVMDGR